ncbi:MAG: type II toxin-antitoxin system Phd/YefM family antitoxin [Acidobacteria bacterium]|nr:type II toxin-antitoxin system Phd/YefM family antitoxin [Acidobacteriota bacterium]
MKLVRDIQSLSVFKRDTAKFRRQLKKTKQPIVLTVNGKADMVVIDAESYDEYLREKESLDLIASVNRGIEDMHAGRTKPAEQVFQDFEKKYRTLLGK